MLTELHGKGGTLCGPAKDGSMRCPLMIRSTAEDVITGELVRALRTLNPRWWLSDFLNEALGSQRFGRQYYQRLRIEPWVNHQPYPRELLPWPEGSTQVDVEITWENPPTTVLIEAKYQSDLAKSTANSDKESRFPADQLLRNIRLGLNQCGYFGRSPLFETAPRDLVVILLSPVANHYLVRRYRNSKRLLRSIPRAETLVALPQLPFIGEIGYLEITQILRKSRRFFNRAERITVEHLTDYLSFKKQTMRPKLPFHLHARQRTT